MARRNPSGNLPSDRTPDRPATGPERDGIKTDTLALKCRDLPEVRRHEERGLVHLAIDRVRVVGDAEETAYVRTLLRSMLLSEGKRS